MAGIISSFIISLLLGDGGTLDNGEGYCTGRDSGAVSIPYSIAGADCPFGIVAVTGTVLVLVRRGFLSAVVSGAIISDGAETSTSAFLSRDRGPLSSLRGCFVIR